MKHILNIVTVAALALPSANGQDYGMGPDFNIRFYEIRMGEVEINMSTKRRYVFHWDGKEKVFDMTPGIDGATDGIRPPGLPDLVEIGFRAKGGQIYEYGNELPVKILGNYFEKHPGGDIVSFLFNGVNGKRMEFSLKSRTPVCRVDILLENGRHITLWKVVTPKDGERRESR
jgi:hypothetical protein